MNLVESVTAAASYLERHGVGSPRLNAEVLLGHLIHLERIEIYTNYDRPLSAEEAEGYKKLLVKRAGGCPLQYLTGDAGFMGLSFEVRQGVFIPRPETEVLALKLLEGLPPGRTDVLDLGTGCGNIAVCVAVRNPETLVLAVDNDRRAVELCRSNAMRYGVSDRVHTLVGDLYDALVNEPSRLFDAIASNPPYVPEHAGEALPVEVKDFEPMEALLGGRDGLDVVRRIVRYAPAHLKAGGRLLLEIDDGQVEEAMKIFAAGWEEVECHEDLAGRPRVVEARIASTDVSSE
jgi:release factor-specific protein-(glutamine-N5) methyltransferase